MATVEVDSGRVVRWAGVACLAVLVVVIVLTAVSAADQNARRDRLRREGVAVDVTITSCTGRASGTGITEVAYDCRGRYTLGGRSYQEAIRGTTALHTPGETLQAVVVRDDPTVVSTSEAVAKTTSSWTPYLTPIVLAGLTVVLAGALVWWTKRHPPVRPSGGTG